MSLEWNSVVHSKTETAVIDDHTVFGRCVSLLGIDIHCAITLFAVDGGRVKYVTLEMCPTTYYPCLITSGNLLFATSVPMSITGLIMLSLIHI